MKKHVTNFVWIKCLKRWKYIFVSDAISHVITVWFLFCFLFHFFFFCTDFQICVITAFTHFFLMLAAEHYLYKRRIQKQLVRLQRISNPPNVASKEVTKTYRMSQDLLLAPVDITQPDSSISSCSSKVFYSICFALYNNLCGSHFFIIAFLGSQV